MDDNRHAGQVAVLTGAGSGIGRATALRLAQEGARVIGCDVSATGLAATEGLLAAAGLQGTFLVADVTSEGDVERLVAAAGERLDILMNIAGIMDGFLPLGELDDATWERVLGVNLTGPMRLTRAALPPMLRQGGGVIVMVGSKASASGGSAGTAYTASKHGLVGLTKSIAYYYGPQGIRCNAVLPGGVETGIGATAAPRSAWAFERARLSMATMAPPVQAEAIATVLSWLASAEATNINGATIAADGGWSAG
jgi:NAD(P)-dependent dehydrogenase (short-subunit alcohol dehydrogenase family)